MVASVFACNSESKSDSEEHKENARTYKSINSEAGDCGISDGSHQARVEYANPKTGYSTEYDLDVTVENCQVIEIDFPKGGYLDLHHIDPTEIDDQGNAELTDDRGREWNIHFDSDEKDNDEDDDSDQEISDQ